MKIQEIISKINESKKSNEGTPLSSLIEIKPYLPLLVKREIVKSVCNMCLLFDEDTEMLKCDYILKDLFYVLNVVLECSDIEIDGLFDTDENGEQDINIEVAIEAYDLIMENDIFDFIAVKVGLFDLELMINEEIAQRMEINNSVSNILRKSINTLMEKIPSEDGMKNLMAQLPSQIASLNDLQILGNGKPKKTTSKASKNKAEGKKAAEKHSAKVVDMEMETKRLLTCLTDEQYEKVVGVDG